jgi:hypothetical protein
MGYFVGDESDASVASSVPGRFALKHASKFGLVVECEAPDKRADTIVVYTGPGWYSLVGASRGQPFPHYVRRICGTTSRIRISIVIPDDCCAGGDAFGC